MDEQPTDNKASRPGSNGLPMLKQLPKLRTNQHRPNNAQIIEQQEALRVEIVEQGNLRWVNIERPGNEELAWLHQNFEVNPLHLEDITSRLQRPKIDDYEDYLFIVLHFPVYNKAERSTFPSEIDIILGPDYIITIHDGKLRTLNRLFEQCKNNSGKRYGVLGRTASFALYRVIDVLVDYCFPIVNKLAEKLEELDERIFASTDRNTIYEISVTRRDIIAFRRIIKPQISVIASLEHRRRTADTEDMEAFYSDVKDHISKIWDSLEDFKDIIEGLSSTYDSLASHRLNQVIKTLTIISVILLPLTLISGLYGMNVGLPFSDQPWSFVAIVAAMITTTTVMLLLFKKQGWL